MACFCERIYKSQLKEVAFSFWTVHGWVSVHRHFNEVLFSIKRLLYEAKYHKFECA